jgi:hypothetical protein
VCIMILADAVRDIPPSASISQMSSQPVELPILSLSLGIIFKFVGAWGVHRRNVRWVRQGEGVGEGFSRRFLQQDEYKEGRVDR